jgi:hypothetical protein
MEAPGAGNQLIPSTEYIICGMLADPTPLAIQYVPFHTTERHVPVMSALPDVDTYQPIPSYE